MVQVGSRTRWSYVSKELQVPPRGSGVATLSGALRKWVKSLPSYSSTAQKSERLDGERKRVLNEEEPLLLLQSRKTSVDVNV